jgi:putative transposase
MGQRRKHAPEQIVSLLRQVKIAISSGKKTAQASKEASITEQTYYRWRKEFDGLQADQARWRTRVSRYAR